MDGDATPYPDGIIPYAFQDSFPQASRATVLAYWNELLTQVNIRDTEKLGDIRYSEAYTACYSMLKPKILLINGFMTL